MEENKAMMANEGRKKASKEASTLTAGGEAAEESAETPLSLLGGNKAPSVVAAAVSAEKSDEKRSSGFAAGVPKFSSEKASSWLPDEARAAGTTAGCVVSRFFPEFLLFDDEISASGSRLRAGSGDSDPSGRGRGLKRGLSSCPGVNRRSEDDD